MRIKKSFSFAVVLLIGVILLNTGAFTAYSANGVISIVHVNDVHGYAVETDTAVGYAKMAGIVEQIKAENPNTIVLDAGDTFGGNAYAAFDAGESIAAILHTVGFDAMTAGNHDYHLGADRLLALEKSVGYPLLIGNVNDAEIQKEFNGCFILTLDNGMKAGIISATARAPINKFIKDPQETINAIQGMMDKVRPQSDIVIGLLHIGDDESAELTSDMISRKVEGFDVIIDGHSHTFLPEGKRVGDTLIAQTGEYFQNIGRVDLTVENGKITDSKAWLLSREEMKSIPEKVETAEAIESLLEKAGKYFPLKIGETRVELVAARDLIRTSETNMGNLYADAFREITGADIALTPAGVIGGGGDLPAGDITMEDILDMSRVNGTVITKEMTGADIVEAIQDKYSSYPEPSGTFLQVSGISLMLCSSATLKKKAFDIKVQGMPIDLRKTYVVALHDITGEDAGFENGRLLAEYGYVDKVIKEYIEKNSPISPKAEGRITVQSKNSAQEIVYPGQAIRIPA